jgi:hypothetical protein
MPLILPMDANKVRVAVAATSAAFAVVGIAYSGYAVLNAIIQAPPMTKFLVGLGGGASGLTGLIATHRGQ